MDDTFEPGNDGEDRHQGSTPAGAGGTPPPGGASQAGDTTPSGEAAAGRPQAWGPPEQSRGGWNPPPPASPTAPWQPHGAWSGQGGTSGPGWGATGAGNPGGWASPSGWSPDPAGWGGPGGSGGWGPGSGGWGPPGSGPWGASGRQPGGWDVPWGPPRPARPRQTLPGTVIALLLVVAVLVGLGIGHGVWKSVATPSQGGPGNALAPGGSVGPGSGSGGDPSTVAAKVSPALVDINTTLSYQRDQAAGTGIVLTPDGVVLTNNHVIAGATSISVTDVGNGKTYPADVVGYDRSHDVAVIKLRNASGLQTAAIGNSDKVSVGDFVVGLGNAGGVGGTPSSAQGNVIGLNRSITASDDANGTTEQLTGLIETNADIQPGDSGGALADSSGRVVGIDTAASAGFSFQTQGNQGFAIPINQAMSIARQIRSGQASASVHIGATAFLGVLVDTRASSQGATLSGVVPSGPAAKLGLQSGDTIVSLGGKAVDSPNTLTALVGDYHPGQSVPISWVDPSGQSHQASITLADGPAA